MGLTSTTIILKSSLQDFCIEKVVLQISEISQFELFQNLISSGAVSLENMILCQTVKKVKDMRISKCLECLEWYEKFDNEVRILKFRT